MHDLLVRQSNNHEKRNLEAYLNEKHNSRLPQVVLLTKPNMPRAAASVIDVQKQDGEQLQLQSFLSPIDAIS